jgi:two-component system, NarL family, nitrate/nitrite response regulator NarL
MRIVLGDGQRLFIDAMAAALTENGVTVTAVATAPAEVLAAIGRHRPDICLLATQFNGYDSASLVDLIRRRHPQVKVVMLAENPGLPASPDVRGAGAAGLIGKDQHLTEIMRILADVLAGEQPVRTDLGHTRGSELSPPVPSDSSWLVRLLTLREQEVLMLIMEGQSTKQIARSLAISMSTARTHIQSVLVKLGAHSRLEATSMVARFCLVGVTGEYSLGPPVRQAAASG